MWIKSNPNLGVSVSVDYLADQVQDAKNRSPRRLNTSGIRKLLSAEGFLSYFLELRQLFPTYEQAYEELEAQHERITGKWMYAEYDTFRRVYKRWLKKEKRSPK